MRFSIQPEPRQEQHMRTLTIDEIVSVFERDQAGKPILEHYFSPTREQAFIKEFLHYLNSGLLEAKHGNLDQEQYLAFVLSFQFTAPLLHIQAEKELGLFYRILQKTYRIEEPDLNLHFSMEDYEGPWVGEHMAMDALKRDLEEFYGDSLEVKQRVKHRLKKDAIAAIMKWQKEENIPALAEAFGRSIVIPSFFSYKDNKLVHFYRKNTEGISYRVAVPGTLL